MWRRVLATALVALLIAPLDANAEATFVEPGVIRGTLGYNHDGYRMEGLYTVPPSDTLRIEGGVRIFYGKWCKWVVKGVVIAGGTNRMSVGFVGDTANCAHPIREFLFDHPTGKSSFISCHWSPGYSDEVPESDFPGTDGKDYTHEPERYLAHLFELIHAEVDLTKCQVDGNQGILVADSASVIGIYNSYFHDSRTTPPDYAMLAVRNHSQVHIIESDFWRNSSGTSLILIENADRFVVQSSKFAENSGWIVLNIDSSSGRISDCTFERNETETVLNVQRGSSVIISDCSFLSNQVRDDGAVIFVKPGAMLESYYCTLAGIQEFRTLSWYEESSSAAIVNYGRLYWTNGIIAFTWPRHAVLTGYPAGSLTSGQVVHMIGDVGLMDEIPGVLVGDTAVTQMTTSCFFSTTEPACFRHDDPDADYNGKLLVVLPFLKTGCLTADPQFLNAASGNIHILPSSPCAGGVKPGPVSGPQRVRPLMGSGGVWPGR